MSGVISHGHPLGLIFPQLCNADDLRLKGTSIKNYQNDSFLVLDVFGRFSAGFALPSWTIACNAPAKASQNLLENQSKSIPS
jgi:hypothetical protein